MPTADSDFSVIYAVNLFTGETKGKSMKRNKSGLSNGSQKAIQFASFRNKAGTARPSFIESLTTGWLAIRDQTKVIWEDANT